MGDGTTTANQAGILDGVRVVDCSEGLAGPVATLLLAEAGADVVKIERPGGDPSRDGLGFRTWNRSKRSVVLDLDTIEGRGDLHRMLDTADVLVHGMGPEAARRRGLTDEELLARHPELVSCAVLAWPPTHPLADLQADDLIVSARLGLCDEQQGYRDGPIFLRFPFGSWCTVYLAAIGILARLVRRGRAGGGGAVHTSVAQGALVPTMMHWARAESPGPMFEWGLPKELVPSMFECADGVWIHLMRNADTASPLMAKLLAEMGEEGVARANAAVSATITPGYPNFGANRQAFRMRPSAEWLEDLWANDLPAQPAAPFGSILSDEQARANGYVIEVEDPEWGTVAQAGTPFGTTPRSRVRGPAPDLGQHTAEVLAELDVGDGGLGDGAREHGVGVGDEVGGGHAAAAARTAGPGVRRPLDGVKVLDFGNFLAGPLGPMLLADLGADVVKVEAVTGDPMRRVERVFASCQRGKRGVALDLKSPEARQALRALVRWADVVHHNLRMPAARRLGLDYESLRAINPQVVYCHASSYGPEGARADWPGYDQLFQASGGWEVLGAGEGNPPMWYRFGFMDHLCAMGSTVATLLALHRRDRTGEGQSVTGSLLGAAVLTNSEISLRGAEPVGTVEQLDAEQTGLSPGYRLYRTIDGWIALAARSPSGLAAACQVAGADRPEQLATAFAGWTAAEALTRLEQRGVPCGPVHVDQGDAFLDDPDNRAAGLVASYRHGEWGVMEQVGALWDVGDLHLRLDRAPPLLGEHTMEVLREVGMESPDIDLLLDHGAALQAGRSGGEAA